jgi:hypothetical protein
VPAVNALPTSVNFGGLTLRLKVRVVECAGVPLSVTVTATVSVTGKPSAPAARTGAPLIVSVAPLAVAVSPLGSPVADHLSTPLPPLAMTVAE